MLFPPNFALLWSLDHPKRLKLLLWDVMFMYGTKKTYLDWFARLKDQMEVEFCPIPSVTKWKMGPTAADMQSDGLICVRINLRATNLLYTAKIIGKLLSFVVYVSKFPFSHYEGHFPRFLLNMQSKTNFSCSYLVVKNCALSRKHNVTISVSRKYWNWYSVCNEKQTCPSVTKSWNFQKNIFISWYYF